MPDMNDSIRLDEAIENYPRVEAENRYLREENKVLATDLERERAGAATLRETLEHLKERVRFSAVRRRHIEAALATTAGNGMREELTRLREFAHLMVLRAMETADEPLCTRARIALGDKP